MAGVAEIRLAVPASIDEAVDELVRHRGRAEIVAGSTDLTLALRRSRAWPDVFIMVGTLAEIRAIRDDARGVAIGAAVTMTELTDSDLIARRYTALAEAARTVGGVQIRNAATVGGNVCNASPGADTPPALLALGASVEIGSAGGRRSVDLAAFFLGPRRTVLDAGELLAGFRLPSPPPRSGSAYLRLTPREALDLAIVGVAAAVTLAADRRTVAHCRVALGAVAPTPLLVAEAGAALAGRMPDAATLAEAGRRAAEACRPIDDVRATAAYRRRMVPVLVERAIAAAVARAAEA
jgi:CO/xanthine dehydrogenase FAD-binding subunit